MEPPHEIIWWKNGKFMGEFQGALQDQVALLDRDSFVFNVPRNRLVQMQGVRPGF
ncbi:MAG TPA: hypothetical protein VNA25_03110 [Phycisphaerae bacterium]|nr:hypothetical protein [Phycisphaerae bacterium]